MRKPLALLSPLLLSTLLVSSAALFGGCAVSDSAYAGSSLWEISPDAVPLASIHAAEWELVPAGCEDRIPEDATFEIAIGANGLLVAVDDQGDAVCADTLEAIQEELEEEGRAKESDDLESSLAVTIGAGLEDAPEHVNVDPAADDPSPQPSCPDPEAVHEMNSMDDGENQPGDPSPQPS